MKCPRCELITSNNKDECPRCGLDFRPQKENLQLSPIAAEVSYSKRYRDPGKSFSDLVVAVDKILDKHKTKVKYDPFVKPIITPSKSMPVLNLPPIEEVELPKITQDPLLKSSTGLQALLELTNMLASSTNLQALTEQTAKLMENPQIIIAEENWKKCEFEMTRLSIGLQDEGFFEVADLKNDNEIPVLFELAEREILNPSSIQSQKETPEKKAKIVTELDQAVKTFEHAHDEAEVLKKLHIKSGDSVTLVTCDFLIPAKASERFTCFVIDLVIALIVALAYSWFRTLPANITNSILLLDKEVAFEMLPYFLDIAMNFYLTWTLSQCILLATMGSTIGGKIMGLGVTDSIGFLLTFRHALLRSLSWSVTILSGGLGALMIFFKHKQTLHDRVARTLVVKLK